MSDREKFFRRQGYHLLLYGVLGALLYFAVRANPQGQGRIWGLTTAQWVLLSWIFAGVHQGWIWFFWRMELYFGKISAWMGKKGFLVFRVGFIVSGLLRFLALIPIALSSPRTLAVPPPFGAVFIIVTTPFILWGLYSVFAYFGVTRAFGADHFDPAYRTKALEKRGTFKYIPNSMYSVVLLALYHPGVLAHSRLALIAAAAHHAFVWTHYFCTEKPDMAEIYGERVEG